MASVSLELQDLDSTLRSVARRYPDRLRRELQFQLQATAESVQNSARSNVPVQTGNLKASIQTDFSQLRDLYAEVKTALEYARIVEYGHTGTQEVRAHTRTIEEAFGEPIEPTTVEVSSHTRQVDRQGSFYMLKAAQAHKQTWRKKVAAAAQRAGAGAA